MVFASREEEIDYLRDELEKLEGRDLQKAVGRGDSASPEAGRRRRRGRRADVYDESGSDEEESDGRRRSTSRA